MLLQHTARQDYTIPSDNRELQLRGVAGILNFDYTIPSDNRELQLEGDCSSRAIDYTIPSDNRELQPFCVPRFPNLIIPYQVITGNYNGVCAVLQLYIIIPYQVITGNYN